MSEFWFKPKRYGYGVTPVTWQGWILTIATAIAVIATSMLVPIFAARTPWVFVAVPIALLLIACLLIVSRRKTEGEWRWRWGRYDGENG
jgi:hypothetical protein